MSHAQKSNDWRPTAAIKTLQLRAQILAKIRYFFADRDVLEVETPQLSHAVGTDPYLHYFTTDYSLAGQPNSHTLYLQTSPEFAMKRLLAAGSGSIFQICKAYRNGEVGKLHNPEFTILEWYRLDFNHHDLMQEMDKLLQYVLQCNAAHYYSYQSLFETHLQFNPHTATIAEIKKKTAHLTLDEALTDTFDKDTWLQYLLAIFIEPELGQNAPAFVYDFPSSQAALARLRQEKDFSVAERFEVYIKGLELANGFHELSDPEEQAKRFAHDLQMRQTKNYLLPPIDERLLAALPSLPPCAGVALGIDRLVMLAANAQHIQDIVAFPFENC